MFLHIYSLDKPKFFHEAISIVVKTKVGELTILDNHQPIITPMIAGTITVMSSKGEQSRFEAKGGVLEVRPGSVVNILAE